MKRTPLLEEHRKLGGKIVPFAGYEMPVRYSGDIEEHLAVRRAAGLFDVSHMGEVDIRGPGAAAYVDYVTPSRISALPIGKVAYSGLTTEAGTFVDDILAYHLGDAHFMFVVNASNRDKDVAWLLEHARRFDVRVRDVSDETALIAIQGPLAREIVAGVAEGFNGLEVPYYNVVSGKVAGKPAMASRTGYTGELGYEILLANADAVHVWNALLDAGRGRGVMPAGLGARDTLRLEAALPLYGNDIDDTTTVLEAALDFIVDWSKESFIGREALARQRETGPARLRCGFELEGRGIPRHGQPVLVAGKEVGVATSGGWAPFLQKGIGMAYLPAGMAQPDTAIEVDVRGRRLPGKVVALPFYKRPKGRKSA
ncbi:MAG: glycine cleavage system aminomethyltransferase GcvT [Acidobacteria bacterium]|nr:glycine cleavage system aminomethyltransferase GcvT [Acidobacteriota bacterium]